MVWVQIMGIEPPERALSCTRSKDSKKGGYDDLLFGPQSQIAFRIYCPTERWREATLSSTEQVIVAGLVQFVRWTPRYLYVLILNVKSLDFHSYNVGWGFPAEVDHHFFLSCLTLTWRWFRSHQITSLHLQPFPSDTHSTMAVLSDNFWRCQLSEEYVESNV